MVADPSLKPTKRALKSKTCGLVDESAQFAAPVQNE